MSFRSTFSAFLLVLVLLPMPAMAARNSDAEFRFCMQLAMNNRENRILDITRNYHSGWQQALEDRRQRLFDAWGVENDKDRTNIIRDAEKNAKNILRDIEKNYRNELKNANTEFKNEEKRCKAEFNARIKEVPVGLICFSTDQCRPPLGYCTVDTGECKQICEPGSNPCRQVCTGKCKVR